MIKFLATFLATTFVFSNAYAYKRVVQFTDQDAAKVDKAAEPTEPVSQEQVQAATNHKVQPTAIDDEILDSQN